MIHSGYLEIGASPYGIVRCDCCGEGSLEVKCPFSVRDEDLLNVKEGATCLTKDESGQLHLRKAHAYYYQVQCQLFMCGHTYGDFVVWTQKFYHCECVAEVLWEEILPKGCHFFQVGVLPELLGKCYTCHPLVGCPVNAVNVDSGESAQAFGATVRRTSLVTW